MLKFHPHRITEGGSGKWRIGLDTTTVLPQKTQVTLTCYIHKSHKKMQLMSVNAYKGNSSKTYYWEDKQDQIPEDRQDWLEGDNPQHLQRVVDKPGLLLVGRTLEDTR